MRSTIRHGPSVTTVLIDDAVPAAAQLRADASWSSSAVRTTSRACASSPFTHTLVGPGEPRRSAAADGRRHARRRWRRRRSQNRAAKPVDVEHALANHAGGGTPGDVPILAGILARRIGRAVVVLGRKGLAEARASVAEGTDHGVGGHEAERGTAPIARRRIGACGAARRSTFVVQLIIVDARGQVPGLRGDQWIGPLRIRGLAHEAFDQTRWDVLVQRRRGQQGHDPLRLSARRRQADRLAGKVGLEQRGGRSRRRRGRRARLRRGDHRKKDAAHTHASVALRTTMRSVDYIQVCARDARIGPGGRVRVLVAVLDRQRPGDSQPDIGTRLRTGTRTRTGRV